MGRSKVVSVECIVYIYRRRPDLSAIRPRQRTPAELVYRVRQEDHGDRSNTRGVRVIADWRRSRAIDNTDDHEAYRHENRSDPEGWSSSPSFAEEEDIDAARDELLGAEQTSNEKILRATAD